MRWLVSWSWPESRSHRSPSRGRWHCRSADCRLQCRAVRPRNSLLSLMQLRAYALSRLVEGKEIGIDPNLVLTAQAPAPGDVRMAVGVGLHDVRPPVATPAGSAWAGRFREFVLRYRTKSGSEGAIRGRFHRNHPVVPDETRLRRVRVNGSGEFVLRHRTSRRESSWPRALSPNSFARTERDVFELKRDANVPYMAYGILIEPCTRPRFICQIRRVGGYVRWPDVLGGHRRTWCGRHLTGISGRRPRPCPARSVQGKTQTSPGLTQKTGYGRTGDPSDHPGQLRAVHLAESQGSSSRLGKACANQCGRAIPRSERDSCGDRIPRRAADPHSAGPFPG